MNVRECLENRPEGASIEELMLETRKRFKDIKQSLAKLPVVFDGEFYYLYSSPEQKAEIEQRIKGEPMQTVITKPSAEPSYLNPEQIRDAVWNGEKLQFLNSAGKWTTYVATDIRTIRKETRPVRRALPVRMINGVQVAVGTDKTPSQNQVYFIPAITAELCERRIWDNNEQDKQYFDWQMVHLSADTAKDHAKALLRASGVSV